jgi:transposase
MVRAIVSVLSRGFACRMLPHDIPPRQTVYPSVRRQRQDGIWTWRTDVLRTEMRRASGREAEPRAATLIASRSQPRKKGGAGGMRQASAATDATGICSLGALGLLLSVGVYAAEGHDWDGDTRSAHGCGNGSRHGQTVVPHPRQQPFLDMVSEYIIRHSPRRRALHSIAKGFSPTARGAYRIIAVLIEVEPIGRG